MTDERDAQGRRILPRSELAAQFRALGVQPGHTLIMHSSLKAVGDWIPGGVQAVVLALFDVLGADGTLMMPAQSSDNTDPAYWSAPPVPESWWPVIRAEMPPYDPAATPTRGLGVLAEYFRTLPGVQRSDHPNLSFAARGKQAEYLVSAQPREAPFGNDSPLGRLVALGGYVLLMGVDHSSNTTLHLAEHRAGWPSKRGIQQGAAVMRDGARRWEILNEEIDYNADDFSAIGADYEQSIGYAPGRIGQAAARYLSAAPMVAYAAQWMNRHRE